MKKLGRKEEATEVENFIQANTKDLGDDKFLCPLSGKKFKGPDFVRKHIFNKHADKLENVKKEVRHTEILMGLQFVEVDFAAGSILQQLPGRS